MKKFTIILLFFVSTSSVARTPITKSKDFIEEFMCVHNIISGKVTSVEISDATDRFNYELGDKGKVEISEHCKKNSSIGKWQFDIVMKKYSVVRKDERINLIDGKGSIRIVRQTSDVCSALSPINGLTGRTVSIILDGGKRSQGGEVIAYGMEVTSPTNYNGAPKSWLKYESQLLEFIQSNEAIDDLLKIIDNPSMIKTKEQKCN